MNSAQNPHKMPTKTQTLKYPNAHLIKYKEKRFMKAKVQRQVLVTWRLQKNFATERVFPDASFTMLLYCKFQSLPTSPTMSDISLCLKLGSFLLQNPEFQFQNTIKPTAMDESTHSSLQRPTLPLSLCSQWSLSLQNTCSTDKEICAHIPKSNPILI